jgi:L-threonine kinase
LSARGHQNLLSKPLLEPAIAVGADLGAAGVCVAHSGTAIGIIFDGHATDAIGERGWIARRLGCPASVVRLVGGGPRRLVAAQNGRHLSLAGS